MSVCVDSIIAAVSSLRLSPAVEEYALHDAIAGALARHGVAYLHEARLAPRCRIDFLCDGVGIEVKRGKPDRRRLIAQCERYLDNEALEALILVVDRAVFLPDELRGKPVVTIGLNRLWGIALP